MDYREIRENKYWVSLSTINSALCEHMMSLAMPVTQGVGGVLSELPNSALNEEGHPMVLKSNPEFLGVRV